MEEDVLSKFRSIVEESREECIYDYYIDLRDTLELLEYLINRNKVLETINKMQEYRISVIDERELIPRSKIREKIEELDKKMAEDEVDEFGIHSQGWAALDWTRDFLLELLQEGDK